jgi:hypothetical protein
MPRFWSHCLLSVVLLGSSIATECMSQESLEDLPRLTPGKVGMPNGLWIENDPSRLFTKRSRVVVADVKGPATITMIHFALPAAQILQPSTRLGRELLLKIYFDGEKQPSVDCPFVDFFCDPAGLRDDVNTMLVNKRRGWNAYFLMPFRQSARVELVYEGPIPPGEPLRIEMPAYSYVMYRTADKIPADMGYFHAHWRQAPMLAGKEEYVALDAKGNGKFVGWNVTMRRPSGGDYMVDVNEKFFVDGEKTAAVEFQGLEDSFGFSWGFPETQNMFPRMGYFPFLNGAAAYRFFLQDSISFRKSLRVVLGFGANETWFNAEYSKPKSRLQVSSTVYWYQEEPHAALPPMPAAAERVPAPQSMFWFDKEKLSSVAELKSRRVRLEMLCGRPEKEVVYAEPGFGARIKAGFSYAGWDLPIYYCRAHEKEVEIELNVPARSAGRLRLFVIDPDRHGGGRKETVIVAGKSIAIVDSFAEGRWVECDVTPEETSGGKVPIQVLNMRDGANAVISMIEWIGSP